MAGLLIGFPQPEWWWQTSVAGSILAVIIVAIMMAMKNKSAEIELQAAEPIE